MAGNIVPVFPTSESQFVVLWNGAFQPHVKSVKLPKQSHGRVTAHPGGRHAPIKAPDGTVEWDDLEIVFFRGEGITQVPLLAWWLSVVHPMTGIGLPAMAVSHVIQVIDSNNSAIPDGTHTIICWPADRDHGSREGGKDKEAKTITCAFAVNDYQEILS